MTLGKKNSNKNYDEDGILASRGIMNEIIFEQLKNYFLIELKNNTYDVNDFDVSFARGLSLEDGTATLTQFTGSIIGQTLNSILRKENEKKWKILLCGGGKKTKF